MNGHNTVSRSRIWRHLARMAAPVPLCLCLIPLAGCGAGTPPITVRLRPPAALLLNTPEPVMAGNSNGALLEYALDLRTALRTANADKTALRQWAAAPEDGGRPFP